MILVVASSSQLPDHILKQRRRYLAHLDHYRAVLIPVHMVIPLAPGIMITGRTFRGHNKAFGTHWKDLSWTIRARLDIENHPVLTTQQTSPEHW